MNVKTKVILKYPLIGLRNFRARRIAKKISKDDDFEKYPIQWRNDYMVKKSKRFLKDFRVDLVVKGFENIPKQSSIITPNHQSSLDPMVVMAALENPEHSSDARNPLAIFIAKEELRKNKKIIGYMDVIGTFFIPRKNPRESLRLLDEAVKDAKENKKHLVIFPEGTRTKNGNLNIFKGGAFRIAMKSFLPITPVTINHTIDAANLRRSKRVKVEIIFHPPLKPMSFISSNKDAIGERVKKIVESKYIRPTDEIKTKGTLR